MTEKGVIRVILFVVFCFCIVFFVYQYLSWTWKLAGLFVLIHTIYTIVDDYLKRRE